MITRMATEKDDPLLTPEDIAKIIPLSTETIRSHIKNGSLPGTHIGRRYFVLRSKVEEWIKTHPAYKHQEDFHSS